MAIFALGGSLLVDIDDPAQDLLTGALIHTNPIPTLVDVRTEASRFYRPSWLLIDQRLRLLRM